MTTKEREARTPPRDWSALPDPAVYIVMKALLPSITDLYSSISVCRAWYGVFSYCKRELLSGLPPFIVAEDYLRPSGALRSYYSFTERRSYQHRSTRMEDGDPDLGGVIVGYSHGYVMASNRRWTHADVCYHGFYIVDPFRHNSWTDGRIDPPAPPYDISLSEFLMTAPPTSPLCVVVAFDEDRIQYWRFGDSKWAYHNFPQGEILDENDHAVRCTNDVLKCIRLHRTTVLQGKLYALTPNGKLLVVDSFLPQLSTAVLNVDGFPQGHDIDSGALVESNGDILYVYDAGQKWTMFSRRKKFRPMFVVLRLDFDTLRWVRVSSLGGRALFLNEVDRPFSCEMTKWGGGGEDRIYCLGPIDDPPARIVVFHMKDGKVEYQHIPELEFRTNCIWALPSFCHSPLTMGQN